MAQPSPSSSPAHDDKGPYRPYAGVGKQSFKNSTSEPKQQRSFWSILAKKAKSALLDDGLSTCSTSDSGLGQDKNCETSQMQYTHSRPSAESKQRRSEIPVLQKRLEALTSSLSSFGGTIGNAIEEGLNMVETKTTDFMSSESRLLFTKKTVDPPRSSQRQDLVSKSLQRHDSGTKSSSQEQRDFVSKSLQQWQSVSKPSQKRDFVSESLQMQVAKPSQLGDSVSKPSQQPDSGIPDHSAADKDTQLKASRDADEGEKQFRAEVSTLGKIHHVNLVRLLGYCTGGRAGEQRALVFEYMENGSLDRFLWRDAAMQQPLAWATRYSIALGTARGIAYLHHDCSPRILHCDIKPQNVLIGHDFSAKVADFGFARRFHLRESHLTISSMRGTRGYMAPEWLTSDEVSSKADVFSFGMLLLELVRGPNMVNDRESLLDWAFQSISAGVKLPQEAAAARSDENINADVEPVQPLPDQQEALEKLQFLRIGLWCIQHMPSMRPPMSRVVQFIEGTIALEDPPNPSPQMTITRLPPFLSDSDQTSTSYVNSSSSYATFSTSVVSGR